MRAEHNAVVLGDHVLDDEPLEPWVLGVQAHPAVLGEPLAGVDQDAPEVVVEQIGEVVPAVGVDRIGERHRDRSRPSTAVVSRHRGKVSS